MLPSEFSYSRLIKTSIGFKPKPLWVSETTHFTEAAGNEKSKNPARAKGTFWIGSYRSGGWSWRGVVWVLPDTCNKLQNYATKSKRRLCNSRRSPWFGTTTAQAQRDGSCEDLHGLVSVGFFEMERCLGHMQRINDWILELVWHTNQKDIWQTSENIEHMCIGFMMAAVVTT